MSKPANMLRDLAEENDKLRDEVEYHRADAKKWALQAMKFDRWQPIETAPKNGAYVLVGNGDGVWIAAYCDRYQSGYSPQNPWQSVMLNHRHMERRNRQWSSRPTHWMPLPQAPKVGGSETATGHCTLGEDRCNCGGDTPGVRAGCANWKTPNAELRGAKPIGEASLSNDVLERTANKEEA